jgi:hypothetical protein
MRVELDHVFVCTSVDAPAAEHLRQFGLHEGPSNRHSGQGTASRRFAFNNAMLELVWVVNEQEARSKRARRTHLWERWSGRNTTASPFGICVRPADPGDTRTPPGTWNYQPSYLPAPLAMHIGEAGLEEPMWVYLGFQRRAQWEQRFVEHPIGLREVTGLSITCPAPPRSTISRVVLNSQVLTVEVGPESLLTLEFDRARRGEFADFRPHLPVRFAY